MFSEQDVGYTAEDIRFTAKDDALYALVLDWPGEKVVIRSLVKGAGGRSACHSGAKVRRYGLYEAEVASVTMLGDGRELPYRSSLVAPCPLPPPGGRG